jgi:hypothetical protein
MMRGNRLLSEGRPSVIVWSDNRVLKIRNSRCAMLIMEERELDVEGLRRGREHRGRT